MMKPPCCFYHRSGGPTSLACGATRYTGYGAIADTLEVLAAERAEQSAARVALNERVKQASGGRLHHQACHLGGLWTGMPTDMSGSPCWCGHDGWSDSK